MSMNGHEQGAGFEQGAGCEQGTGCEQGAGCERTIVLATHNAHKVEELRAILATVLDGLTVLSAADVNAPEPVEDAVTFEGNALIKARALAEATGLPAIADDSGLAVDVLGGAPGIFSARWCGHHGDDAANLQLLLDQLSDIAPEHRGAQFVCAAALVVPGGHEVVERGEMVGTLLYEPRGSHGFGYDPIFKPEGYELSAAELEPEEKNAISHRARAFEKMAVHVQELFAK